MADVEALMAEARSSILTGTKVINLAQHLEPTAVQG